ncbi:MarR family EPS-associated transcriptional regulator [Arhodomonas sp. SL1]|uniref:MarR family EPS-associated transcriptional regulator n=1 Tax=Arhodomonas sp. SL1 TaxID=3425691 RepID=UPI003F882245
MDTSDATRYRVLKILESDPGMNQRQIAEAMGVSVGKANYVLKGLKEKGLIKAENFRRSDKKLAYLYKLTPNGVAEKIQITRRYLSQRMAEYEAIREEIAALKAELGEGE